MASNPDLAEDYQAHLRKFVPVLRSYNLTDTAEFFRAWTDGELEPAPLLDISAPFGLY